MYKVQTSLHKVFCPYVPSILCVELWNSEKKIRKFPDTRSCFLSSHNKKYEAKNFLKSYLFTKNIFLLADFTRNV